jgi:hypothetical protein
MTLRMFAVGAFLCAAVVGGCANPGNYPSLTEADSVGVDDVINLLKCELRDFYASEDFGGVSSDFYLPANKKADVDLKLQIDVSDSAKGSVKLTPLASLLGASFAPSVGLAVTNTILSEYKFTMRQTIAGQGQLDENACPKDSRVLGLKESLVNFYNRERKIQSGAPYVGLQTITYSTAFGLTWSGGATASGAAILTFIPLGPALELSASKAGVHTLQIVFKGKAAATPKPVAG